MEILDEIRLAFATVKKRSAQKIISTEPYDCWVLKSDDWYGVGVPAVGQEDLSERFVDARLWSDDMMIDNIDTRLILLTSTQVNYRHEFAAICAQFVDPGKGGVDRKALQINPLEWWARWRDLLGNAVKVKSPYSVLGELIALEQHAISGEQPKWTGIDKATHDISTQSASYEVKSTISRYETTVTISSQYQLECEGKDLFLIFCRFEETMTGRSMTNVVDSLVTLGFDRLQLDKGLTNLGFEPGCSDRARKYSLLEMRRYMVDDSFPKLTSKSFADGKMPESVVSMTYTINLANLTYVKLV